MHTKIRKKWEKIYLILNIFSPIENDFQNQIKKTRRQKPIRIPNGALNTSEHKKNVEKTIKNSQSKSEKMQGKDIQYSN